ncbi:uncharacterized protein LOC124359444 isoform X3 [Homalodisca vitripennis]|uniref:uncharacterized protein LOC124359444 isoform X3 n=1 Tax=Homalodisca vitripennis TaxID=197043 RepID=UPI001EEA2EC6|nr:uncharacterized protein LOC124359444 isoform X3 [Homalodisca vitripennis]
MDSENWLFTMDEKKYLNCSQRSSSKFLGAFSSSSSKDSNSEIYQPISKKPKLDIDKRFGLSGSIRYSSRNSSPDIRKSKCSSDDLWGDDPDSDEVEQVFSQVEIKKPQVEMKTGTKFRRTASSGWPSSSSFSSEFSNQKLDERATNGLSSSQILDQNKRLKETLAKSSGEASILREKNKRLEKDMATLKCTLMEKLEIHKKETELERSRLLRENKSLKSQLKVKDMEKQADESRLQHLSSTTRLHSDSSNSRFQGSSKIGLTASKAIQQSLYEECMRNVKSMTRTKTQYLSFELLQKLVFPELSEPTQPEPNIMEPVRTATGSGLFSGLIGSNRQQNRTSSSGNSSKSMFFTAVNSKKPTLPQNVSSNKNSNNVFITAISNEKTTLAEDKKQPAAPCPTVESCIAPLLSVQTLDITSQKGQEIVSQVIKTCQQILSHQLNQLRCAPGPQNRDTEKNRELIYCKLNNLRLGENYNLLSGKELYNNERGIGARRALALLSILADISDFAVERILLRPILDKLDQKSKDGGTDGIKTCTNSSQVILSIVNDIAQEIYLKRKITIFEGVLAGAITLVRNLLLSSVDLSKESQDTVVQMLRSVVMARPGSLVLHQVLQLLLAATKYTNITEKLCHNSKKGAFLEDRVKSGFTFTAGSCVLQVLCKQVEIVESSKKYLLSDIFTSWVLTLFYGNSTSPWWLFSVPSQSSCSCRPLISRLSFTLLGEACFIYPKLSPLNSEKPLYAKLLTQGIPVVSTLLFQDDYFGANVDADSVGYYELFVHSMTTFDIKLNEPCRNILESLCMQEYLRQPMCKCEGDTSEVNDLLKSLSCISNDSEVQECLNFQPQTKHIVTS